MAKEATKTSPFGVRFDSDLLEGLKLAGIARSPQHALNLYEKSYLELIELKVKMNNEPEKKEEILEDVKKFPRVHKQGEQMFLIGQCVWSKQLD